MQFPRVRFYSRGSRSIPQDVWREADGQTVRRLGFATDRRAEWDEAPDWRRDYRERCLKLFTFPSFEDRVLRYRDRSMRILRMG